jgi:hypothetical protein
MDQGDDCWDVVRYRVKKLIPLLNNLGQWCALHKLEERDLPPTLPRIFQALRKYALHIPDPSYYRLINSTPVN